MSKRKLLRVPGGLLLLNGILLLALGRAYVRAWQIGPAKSVYRQVMDWFSRRPGSLLRALGAAEAGLGLVALDETSVGVRSLYRIVARFYDRIAPVWTDWGYRQAYVALDRAYADYLPDGGHILDLGCGTGANLERLLSLDLPFERLTDPAGSTGRAGSFGSYTGVDLSEDMLAHARAKFESLPNVRFEQLDLAVEPLPEGPFDLIVSTWAFEHLAEPTRVATKAWERLRPGGHMVLLFEVETNAWRDRLIDPVWRFFSAHLFHEEEYRHIPGVISLRRIPGIGPTLALLVSRRSEKPDRAEISRTGIENEETE